MRIGCSKVFQLRFITVSSMIKLRSGQYVSAVSKGILVSNILELIATCKATYVSKKIASCFSSIIIVKKLFMIRLTYICMYNCCFRLCILWCCSYNFTLVYSCS